MKVLSLNLYLINGILLCCPLSVTGWVAKLQEVLDRGTCQAVLNVAASKGSAGLATHMWNTMNTVYGYPPTVEAYGAMIHAFGKASSTREGGASAEDLDHSMLAALLEMEERGLGPASRGALCSMAAHLATSEDRTDAAYFLLKDFHDEWLQHNEQQGTAVSETASKAPATSGSTRRVHVSALNAVIRACALQQSLGRAFATFDEINNTFGLEPDLGSYNALLDACSQRRFAEGLTALALLEDIKNTSRLEPDDESYHLTLLALVRSGHRAQVICFYLHRGGVSFADLEASLRLPVLIFLPMICIEPNNGISSG